MFVSKKQYERDMKWVEKYADETRSRYYELLGRHERLMDHLGLYEYKKQGVEIRSKDGLKPGP